MSRRTTSIGLLVLALVLVVAALAGCGGDTDKANAAIGAANAHITTYNKLDGEIADLMGQMDALSGGKDDAQKGKDLSDKITAKIAERAKVIAGMKTEFGKIGSMDVSEDLKTYASQQVEIADMRAKVDAKMGEVAAKLSSLFSAAVTGKIDQAMVTKLTAEVDTLTKQLDTMQAQADEKEAASEKFFNDKGLGK